MSPKSTRRMLSYLLEQVPIRVRSYGLLTVRIAVVTDCADFWDKEHEALALPRQPPQDRSDLSPATAITPIFFCMDIPMPIYSEQMYREDSREVYPVVDENQQPDEELIATPKAEAIGLPPTDLMNGAGGNALRARALASEPTLIVPENAMMPAVGRMPVYINESDLCLATTVGLDLNQLPPPPEAEEQTALRARCFAIGVPPPVIPLALSFNLGSYNQDTGSMYMSQSSLASDFSHLSINSCYTTSAQSIGSLGSLDTQPESSNQLSREATARVPLTREDTSRSVCAIPAVPNFILLTNVVLYRAHTGYLLRPDFSEQSLAGVRDMRTREGELIFTGLWSAVSYRLRNRSCAFVIPRHVSSGMKDCRESLAVKCLRPVMKMGVESEEQPMRAVYTIGCQTARFRADRSR
ncbi:hypothetical protein NM688_g629 [Phlebia brevispora]|uniref:Uncharacterized protein n=1 Tax=Phlebia brevispora TaxID=194682 RepID=A0ACC1TDT2_9APHY|nr:hypothetical protein NM688_g629 [Phlebia brevispora]